MPDSVIAHTATGFSQILYQSLFDTIKKIYENCEWDFCVWLILNNLLANVIHNLYVFISYFAVFLWGN